LKILLSFLQDNGGEPHNIPAYRFWSYYIKNGIEEAGYKWSEVPQVDWAEGLTYAKNDPQLKIWREKVWDETIKYIKANQSDITVFLTYLYPQQIEVTAIQEIQKLGIPCVNFYCDNIRQFTRVPWEFKVFDLIWVPEFEALPMYKKAAVNHIHLPMPMWVQPQYRNTEITENSVISFIGSKDMIRAGILSTAIQKGLQLEVRGAGWMDNYTSAPITAQNSLLNKLHNQSAFIKQHGLKGFMIYHRQKSEKVSNVPAEHIFEKPGFDDYIKLTRESSITLGINSVPTYKALNSNPLAYSRLRDIEAPMLGACYLTEYTKGLNTMYNLGTEIETYSSVDELVAKCNDLIKSPAKRKLLREHGQQKALNILDIPSSLQKLKHKLFN
jgi:hypothetical protein